MGITCYKNMQRKVPQSLNNKNQSLNNKNQSLNNKKPFPNKSCNDSTKTRKKQLSVIEQEEKYATERINSLKEKEKEKEKKSKKDNISKDIVKKKKNNNAKEKYNNEKEIKSKEIKKKEKEDNIEIKGGGDNKLMIRNSYKDFNLDKNYYIVCPECKLLQPNIKDLNYDVDKNDFIISYICECNKTKNAKSNYLVNLMSPEKPKNENMKLLSSENCEKLNSLLREKKDIFKGKEIKSKLYEIFPIDESIAPPINLFKSNRKQENSINNNLDVHIEISQNYFGSVMPIIREENFRKYKCIKTLDGHKDKISSIIQLSSGLIATGSYDSQILIYNIEEYILLKCFQENGYVLSLLEFKPNFLLSGTSSNTISLWNLSSENSDYIFKFEGHEFWVNCLVKCNENFFASGSNDKTIRIWNYNERKEIRTINAHSNIVDCLILLKNGNLCSGGDDNLIKIWNWKNGELIYEIKGHQNDIKCLHEFNEEFLISGSDDKTIKIWENYQEKKNINGHNEAIVDLCLIDENTFASGSFDFTIKIWDINSLDCLQTLDEHKDKITGIIKLKNKNILVSCSCDETVKVWKQD